MFNPNNLPENRRGLLRFWCQTVLPLVYDESLSYYELLCKITGYVNELIEDVKNLETEVDALDGRVTVVETAVENLDGRVETVENAVENLDNRVGTLETDVDNVETEVNALDGRVETVENAVENLETESERYVKSVYESYESPERVDLNEIENPSIISVKPSNTDNLPDDSNIMRYAGAMLTHNFEKNEKKHVLQLYLMSSTEPKMYVRYKNFGEGAESVGNWTEWFLVSTGGNGAGFELPEMASNLSDMTDKEKVYIYSVDYQLYKYDADSDSFAETGLYWALPPEFIMHPLPSKIVDVLTPDYFNTMGVVRYETNEIPNSVGDLMIIKDALGYIKQVAYGDDSTIYMRSYDAVAQEWTGWDSVTNDLSGYFHVMNNVAFDMNLNNTNGVYHIENVTPFLNVPDGLTGKCQLIVIGDTSVERQLIITHENRIYTRDKINGSWGVWAEITSTSTGGFEIKDINNLDEANTSGFYHYNYGTTWLPSEVANTEGYIISFISSRSTAEYPTYPMDMQILFTTDVTTQTKTILYRSRFTYSTGVAPTWGGWENLSRKTDWVEKVNKTLDGVTCKVRYLNDYAVFKLTGIITISEPTNTIELEYSDINVGNLEGGDYEFYPCAIIGTLLANQTISAHLKIVSTSEHKLKITISLPEQLSNGQYHISHEHFTKSQYS